MTRVSAGVEGVPTPRMRPYYGDFARGGFGVVITEGTYTDTDASQGYEGQPGMVNDLQQDAWRVIADEVRLEGSVIIMQLMHAGALAQRAFGRTIAPTALRPRGEMMPDYGGHGPYPLPTEMTLDDLAAVRQGFVNAAKRASNAGFDGVEIHAANGYLLDQFNTWYTNLRVDEYGGSPDARIRYAAEIVSAVRAATPTEFIVGVRVSEAKVNDFDYRWPGGTDEATTIFSALARAGASYIHIAGEGRGFKDALAAGEEPFSSLARRVTGLPIIANGGLDDIDTADAVIAGDHADLVAIGRAALANPDWPRKVADGRPIASFEKEMISPIASIENTDRWEQIRSNGKLGASATPKRRRARAQ